MIGRQEAPFSAELGVPGDDGGVAQATFSLANSAGVVGQAVALLLARGRGDLVPLAGRRDGADAVGPEPGDLRLVGGAVAAGRGAKLLDLVVRRRPRRLVRSGGPAGRNWLSLVMANGVSVAQFGSRAGTKAGDVGCQSPMPFWGVNGTTVLEPSLARAVSIASATVRP